MTQARRNSAGVTLVELLISLVVISFALVPILNFYNFYIRQSAKSNQITELKFLAQEEMERLIALDYRHNSMECFGVTSGRTEFYERDKFLIKTNVVFVDPETGERPDLYPVKTEQDTQLKKVTVSVSRKQLGSPQVDYVYFKSP